MRNLRACGYKFNAIFSRHTQHQKVAKNNTKYRIFYDSMKSWQYFRCDYVKIETVINGYY